MSLKLNGFLLKDTILLNGFSAKYLYLHFASNDSFSGSNGSISEGSPVYSMIFRGDHELLLPDLLVGADYDVKFFFDKQLKGFICTEVTLHKEEG